mmetsp:Transcript_10672/g.18967  ORF Transcript_10672/g.18967 Transcript_10672/m.18967 type:complete len:87 (-) Transcript_10672:3-263(-)
MVHHSVLLRGDDWPTPTLWCLVAPAYAEAGAPLRHGWNLISTSTCSPPIPHIPIDTAAYHKMRSHRHPRNGLAQSNLPPPPPPEGG